MSDLSLFDLSGEVAVVTGGNGGIGRSIALGLARAGAAIAIMARNGEKNQAVLAELKALEVPRMVLTVDVADRAQLQPAWDKVEQALGSVGILVNNAGIALLKGTLDQSAEEWDRVIDTNLNACFLLGKLAARSMVAHKAGKIINIASEYAVFGSGLAPSYSAAKGGLVQLTKSMAIELAPHNVQVNALAPGWIDTDLTQPLRSTPLYEEVISRTPAGRFGTPDECAGAAIFLASHASDFVTGSTLFVDGGYAIR
jgi:2-deoxy-D-gluconate 3-dehydrogenase